MNKHIVNQILNILSQTGLVIAVRSYNSSSNRLEGHNIFLFSDKAQGISLYSNGQIILGKYNTYSEKGIYEFTINPKYDLPWVKNNSDIQLRRQIKVVINELIAKNKIIMEKHYAIKLLIDNYLDCLNYCIQNKFMRFNQINHLITQNDFVNKINVLEIAADKVTNNENTLSNSQNNKSNNVSIRKDDITMKNVTNFNKEILEISNTFNQLNTMAIAQKIRRIYLKDSLFASYKYSVQLSICLKEAWYYKKHNEILPIVNNDSAINEIEIKCESIIESKSEVSRIKHQISDEAKSEVSIDSISEENVKTNNNVVKIVNNQTKINNKEILKGRIPGKVYLTFEPGYFFYEDCYGNKQKTFDLLLKSKSNIIRGKTLDQEDVKWTERAFGRQTIMLKGKMVRLIDQIPIDVVFVHSKLGRIPEQKGRMVVNV